MIRLFLVQISLVWCFVLLSVDGSEDLNKYYKVVTINVSTSQNEADTLSRVLEKTLRRHQVRPLPEDITAGSVVEFTVRSNVVTKLEKKLDRIGASVTVRDVDLFELVSQVDFENNLARDAYNKKKCSYQSLGLNPVKRQQAPNYFMDYDEMVDWMEGLRDATCDRSVVTSIGKSYEQRDIYMLEVNKDREDLPAIFLDSTIHAGEFIAPGTLIWIMRKILLGKRPNEVRLRENYRWYFLPCVNPDGYQYAHHVNRIWRKNRQPNPGSDCIGTDLNRDFPATEYGTYAGCGRDTNPCSAFYGGPENTSFTTPETRAYADAFLARPGIELHMAFHSYGQYWFLPWAGLREDSSDIDELRRVAEAGVAGIQSVNGLTFSPVTTNEFFYCSPGTASDWVKNGNPEYRFNSTGAGVKYSHTVELRPAPPENFANLTEFERIKPFIAPPAWIHPSGREIYAGVVAAIDAIFGEK